MPPEHRHLVNIYVDELATVVNGMPSDIELAAERARGLGARPHHCRPNLGPRS